MKIRFKKSGIIGYSNYFNINSINEVLTGDDSVFIHDLDVYLRNKEKWMDMAEAFKSHDLVCDNYFTMFFEPDSEEDRVRGYTL